MIIRKLNVLNTRFLVLVYVVSFCVVPTISYAMLQRNNRFIEASVSKATLIEPQDLTFSSIEITEPGVYLLANDLIFAPATPQPAIHIKTGGVQLDLNKRNVVQATPTPGVAGIFVDPDLTGIQIRNGFVLQFTSTGIVFNEGDSFFSLQDLILKGCALSALDFAGTSTTKSISSGIITRVSATESATGSGAVSVFNCSYVDNVLMSEVHANKCGNQNQNITIFNFENATECQFLGSNLIDNHGETLTCFNFESCEDLLFTGIRAVNNSSLGSGGDFLGFNLTGNCKSNIFNLCLILNNFAINGNFVGVNVDENCGGNIFFQPRIIENEGNALTGACFLGSGSPSNNFNNILAKGFILRNRSLTDDCFGVVVSRSDSGLLKKNNIAYNTAEFGVAAGIFFESGTGGDEWGIKQCEVFKNLGMDDANSYGILIETGTQNVFIQNVAFQNGTILANQLNGIPAGSQEQVDSTNLNSVTAPWTNLAVVS